MSNVHADLVSRRSITHWMLAGMTSCALAHTARGQKLQMALDFQQDSRADSVAIVPNAMGTCDIAMAGYSLTSGGLVQDGLITRHQVTGALLWARAIAGPTYDAPTSIAAASNGDVVVVFITDRVAPDMMTGVMRIDAAGNLVWANVYPGSFTSSPKLRVASNGDICVVNSIAVGTTAYGEFIRVSPSGVPLFVRRYAAPPSATYSPPIPFDLAPFGTDFFLCGNIVDGVTGRQDAAFLRVDATGLPLAAWSYDVPLPNIMLTAISIDADPLRGLVWGVRVEGLPPPFFPLATMAGSCTITGVLRGNSVLLDTVPIYGGVRFDLCGTFVMPLSLVVGANVGAAFARFPDTATGLANFEIYHDLNLATNSQLTAMASPACDTTIVGVGHTTDSATPTLPFSMFLVKADTTFSTGCREFQYFPTVLSAPMVASQRAFVSSDDVRVQVFPGTLSGQTPNPIVFCANSLCPRLPTVCPVDLDDGSGTGVPDCGVDISDLVYFLGCFNAGLLCADLDDGSGTGLCDGGVGLADLLYFLFHFNAGC